MSCKTKEVLRLLEMFAVALDIIKQDINNISHTVGYTSPNLENLKTHLRNMRIELDSLKIQKEKEKTMDFGTKENITPEQKPGAKQEAQAAAETAAQQPQQENTNIDEYGISLDIDPKVRAELAKTVVALNQVALYVQDVIRVTHMVFARYIAGAFDIPEEAIYQEIDHEFERVQKQHEKDAMIDPAEEVKKNGK